MKFKKFVKKHWIGIVWLGFIITIYIGMQILDVESPISFVVYPDGRDKPIMERSCSELEYLLNEGWFNRPIGGASDSSIIEIMKIKGCF